MSVSWRRRTPQSAAAAKKEEHEEDDRKKTGGAEQESPGEPDIVESLKGAVNEFVKKLDGSASGSRKMIL
jgi:hypothetical protein